MGDTVNNQFWDRGYCVIEDLLDQSKLDLAAASLRDAMKKHPMVERNSGYVLNAHDQYSPAIGELLLRHCRPVFEKAIGRELQESFAYWRVYDEGAVLRRHLDRVGCEISATLLIVREPADVPWPIRIEDMHSNEIALDLKPGSALLYQGHEIPHWRDTFTGTSQLQLLFHYVLADGEFSNRKFDGREIDPVDAYYVAK